MISGPATARVLVVSDKVADAAQVLDQLGDEYEQVRSSTDPATSVADFETFRPDVLLLAFDRLDKAQSYSLGLYRHSPMVATHRHATVLLVSKGEVKSAFELCKKGNFDDYLLHWPHAQDGQRLAMSVWNAARSVALQPSGPGQGELDRHARQLVEMDALLLEGLAEGEIRADGMVRARHAAEQAMGAAIDAFAQGLADRAQGSIVAPGAGEALARAVTSLKAHTLADASEARAAELATAASSQELRARLEPHLAAMRGFVASIAEVRRSVLVIDDDPLTGKLIAHALQDQNYDLAFAKDGAEALQLLRRARPHLILMDIRLPDMDGIALTRKLKSAPHLVDIPVLMLTGDARRETFADSVGAGAIGFIVKPFTRDGLMQQLARALSPLPS